MAMDYYQVVIVFDEKLDDSVGEIAKSVQTLLEENIHGLVVKQIELAKSQSLLLSASDQVLEIWALKMRNFQRHDPLGLEFSQAERQQIIKNTVESLRSSHTMVFGDLTIQPGQAISNFICLLTSFSFKILKFLTNQQWLT